MAGPVFAIQGTGPVIGSLGGPSVASARNDPCESKKMRVHAGSSATSSARRTHPEPGRAHCGGGGHPYRLPYDGLRHR